MLMSNPVGLSYILLSRGAGGAHPPKVFLHPQEKEVFVEGVFVEIYVANLEACCHVVILLYPACC